MSKDVQEGWRAWIPTPSQWEGDFKDAEARFGAAMGAVFKDELVEADRSLAEPGILDKIDTKIITTLSGESKPIKLLRGLYDAFKGACKKIGQFLKSSSANKWELIKATCNAAVKAVKVAARKAAIMIDKAAKSLGTQPAVVAIALFASTSLGKVKETGQAVGRAISERLGRSKS